MRLTLRTLLAYLDGILPEQDAADIEKKINDSPVATELMHRVRDLMRRLRLAAPNLDDPRPELDCNTVAEYLDNTLTSENVAAFEKACLESDVHLAEIAAGHQILSRILGEPVDIEPESRDRMYKIPEQLANNELPEPKPTLSPGTVAQRGGDGSDLSLDLDLRSRVKPTVPDYLRESKRPPRLLSVIAGGAVAAILVLVVVGALLFTLGQLEPGTPLGDLAARIGFVAPAKQVASNEKPKPAPDANKDATEKTTDKEGTSVKENANKPDAGEKPSQQSVEDIAAGKAPKATEPEKADEGPKPEQANLAATANGEAKKEAEPRPSEKSPLPIAKDDAAQTAADAEKRPATPPTEKENGGKTENGEKIAQPSADLTRPDREAAPKADATPPAEKTAENGASPKSADAKKASDDDSAKTTGEKEGDKEKQTPAATPKRLGRLITEDQILLLRGDDDTGWTRAPNKSLLFNDQPLLSLPANSPEIAMTNGLTVRAVGGTRFELVGFEPPLPPGVIVRYGRLTMMPVANPDTTARLSFGARSLKITFSDADSLVAIDVRRATATGDSPERDQERYVADFYVAVGKVTVEETGKQTITAKAPCRYAFNDAAEATLAPATKELPKWISDDVLSPLDQKASQAITQAFSTEKSARQTLLELASHRQKEVRLLAERQLCHVDYFDPMAVALGDVTKKLNWADYITQLRDAVARNKESAAAVRQSLERHYPQSTAATLYRMLWGFSDDQLKNGEDEKLVRGLENENLAVRVLSFWNLKELTGLSFYYRPEDTQLKRQQPTARWKQRLDAHGIRAKSGEEKASGAAAKEILPTTNGE